MRGTASAFLALICTWGATIAVAQQTARDGVIADSAQGRAASKVTAYISKSAAFSFPYEPATPAPEDVAAIYLLASLDRGATWQLYAQHRPDVKEFSVRTNGDGEFWFCSQIVDRNKGLHPARPSVQWTVVVDSRPPELQFDATVDASGRMTATWEVDDPHAAPQVALEYRGVDEQQWRTVDLTTAEVRPQAGKAEFQPATSSYFVVVRLRVADQAGNTAGAERRLLVPRAARSTNSAQAQAQSPQPPQDPFSRGRPDHEGATAWPENEQQHLEQNQPAASPRNDQWRSNDVADARSEASAPADEAASNNATSNSPTAAADGAFVPAGDVAASKPFKELTEAKPNPGEMAPPVANHVESDTPGGPTYGADALTTLSDAIPEQSDSAAVGGARPDRAPGAFPPPERSSPLPPGEDALMLNRVTFPLAYDVESVGPSGIASVTLWGTRDGGKTWVEWGADTDHRSPIDVEVGGDGLFGFRIVAKNRDGLAGETPQPGSVPDIWVNIDTTIPTARITAAPYGVGEQAGRLNIQWEADDANLGERPVTLLFTDDPSGRWTTIAAGLPNDGRYIWRVDAHVPRQVYLRLEVRDKAGNLGVHQLTEPINVAGLRPKARIRGVLPIDQTPRGAHLPRTFR